MGIDKLLELRWFRLRTSTYKRDEVGRIAAPKLHRRCSSTAFFGNGQKTVIRASERAGREQASFYWTRTRMYVIM